MANPYDVVRRFEAIVAEYAGSKFAVAVDSCSNAIFLCCKYFGVKEVTIPARTYVSVPCAIIHAGGTVNFEHIDWRGLYQLKPYPIYDSALRFTSGMYIPDSYQCLSFHIKKLIPIGKGGMILTNDKQAAEWFKLARYEGRHEVPLSADTFEMVGWNMYITPEQAARGMMLMQIMPYHNDDIEPDYPDLSAYEMYTKANRKP